MFCGAKVEKGRASRGESKGKWGCRGWTLQNQGWDSRRAAERVQQERKRKERKTEGVVDGMGWTAGNKTGEEKSEITLCIGSEVPEDTWRAGRDVGLQKCSPGFVLPGSPPPGPHSPHYQSSKRIFSCSSKWGHTLPSCIPTTVGLIFHAI